MKRIVLFLSLISVFATLPASAQRTGPWPKEKAWEWYNSQPWIRGCNYMSADCANIIDQWQRLGFEERLKTQDIELDLAESIGFNTLRLIFAEEGFGIWLADHKGLMDRFERTLQMCDKHGCKAIIVLGNDCSRPKELWELPKPGKQTYDWGYHGGRKLSQHGSFPGEVGYTCLDDPKLAPKFYDMCREIITKYKDDDRILFWNLWNEPGNNNRGSLTRVNMRKLFELAWEIDPKQPLAADVWINWGHDSLAGDLSDIISFHLYRNYDMHKWVVEDLRERYDRPLINTEWMARILDCNIEDLYPWFEQQRIGCTMWGFVAGKFQTYEPWEGMWRRLDNGEGKEYKMDRWFHDLYRPSLRPYNPTEVDIIKHVNHQADIEDGLVEGKTVRQGIESTCAILSQDLWHGYRRTSFKFYGYDAWVVEPGIAPAEGCPWTIMVSESDMYADRVGATDLLPEGWHGAYINAPAEILERFCLFAANELGLSAKASVIGLGEAGYSALELAAAHPESVSCLYLDGVKMKCGGEQCGMAHTIADNHIPVLLVYGTQDNVVAPGENSETFASKLEGCGGNVRTIAKELFGHHPYGLDPGKTQPITDFLVSSR